MKLLKPRYGSIFRILIVSDGFIVVEHNSKFTAKKPNLYKLDLELNPVWEAEMQEGFRAIYNIFIRDNILMVHDGTGEAKLNPDTGECTDWLFTK